MSKTKKQPTILYYEEAFTTEHFIGAIACALSEAELLHPDDQDDAEYMYYEEVYAVISSMFSWCEEHFYFRYIRTMDPYCEDRLYLLVDEITRKDTSILKDGLTWEDVRDAIVKVIKDAQV